MKTVIELNDTERKILELLYEYRKLDSKSLHQQTRPDASRATFNNILAKLEATRLIDRKPQPGYPSMVSLRKAGADAIGKTLNSQHYRQVGTRVLQHRQAQLQIEQAANRLSLIIYREQPPAPNDKERIESNPNRQILLSHYRALEHHNLELLNKSGKPDHQRIREFNANINPVPQIFRDYYIHPENTVGAVIILSRPTSDARYWRARATDYAALAAKGFPVLAVFNREPNQNLADELKATGLKLTTLENFEAALKMIFGIE